MAIKCQHQQHDDPENQSKAKKTLLDEEKPEGSSVISKLNMFKKWRVLSFRGHFCCSQSIISNGLFAIHKCITEITKNNGIETYFRMK